MSTTTLRKNQDLRLRRLTLTAIMAALSSVLMMFSVNVPLMPGFIKLDFSEVPALLSTFAMGPIYGIAVCLIKNLVNLFFTTTGGVGELSNFILGVLLVLPAGIIYKKKQNFSGAILGAVSGAVCMALVSVVTNYFIVYPIYTAFMPMEAIMGMYQAINPLVDNLLEALVVFNLPFTFIKGMIVFGVTSIIYVPLMPVIRKNNLL